MIQPKRFLVFLLFLSVSRVSFSQGVKFEEYDLPNGLHVILHEDHHVPIIAQSVMYHVGAKNESVGRSGFAHFFEHLLFEGSENLKRGDFIKYVTSRGGQLNANTTEDRTFFYELLPSSELELAMWLESERMMHPKISEDGVKKQNEVVKEEKRQNFENKAYGGYTGRVSQDLFTLHNYRNGVIGTMKDLDAAKLPEFKTFFETYYVPSNAVLCISGDFDQAICKKMINDYYGTIPAKPQPIYKRPDESMLPGKAIDTAYDSNIKTPAIFLSYKFPAMNSKEAVTMSIISSILTGGPNSLLRKRVIDSLHEATQVSINVNLLEDLSYLTIGALPKEGITLNQLKKDILAEISALQNNLISKEQLTRLQNQLENSLEDRKLYALSVAESLSNGYLFYQKNTGRINHEFEINRSVTSEDIRECAKKYLRSDHLSSLYYLPGKSPSNNLNIIK